MPKSGKDVSPGMALLLLRTIKMQSEKYTISRTSRTQADVWIKSTIRYMQIVINWQMFRGPNNS